MSSRFMWLTLCLSFLAVLSVAAGQKPNMVHTVDHCQLWCCDGLVLAPGDVWRTYNYRMADALSNITAKYSGLPQAYIPLKELGQALRCNVSDPTCVDQLFICVEWSRFLQLCPGKDDLTMTDITTDTRCGFLIPCTKTGTTCPNGTCNHRVDTKDGNKLLIQIYHNALHNNSLYHGTIQRDYTLMRKDELTTFLDIRLREMDFLQRPTRLLIGFEMYNETSEVSPPIERWNHSGCWMRDPSFNKNQSTCSQPTKPSIITTTMLTTTRLSTTTTNLLTTTLPGTSLDSEDTIPSTSSSTTGGSSTNDVDMNERSRLTSSPTGAEPNVSIPPNTTPKTSDSPTGNKVDTNGGGDQSAYKAGMIAGCVIAGFLFGALVVLLIVIIRRRTNRNRNQKINAAPTHPVTPEDSYARRIRRLPGAAYQDFTPEFIYDAQHQPDLIPSTNHQMRQQVLPTSASDLSWATAQQGTSHTPQRGPSQRLTPEGILPPVTEQYATVDKNKKSVKERDGIFIIENDGYAELAEKKPELPPKPAVLPKPKVKPKPKPRIN